jgi:hypothetical protein
MRMTTQGTVSKVIESGGAEVPCAPIHDILERYTNGTRQHVDLWILDVEGHEMNVLGGTDFSRTQVDVMVIEDVWLRPMPRMLDVLMGRNGFIKYQQLVIDSVFVRRGSTGALSDSTPWMPPSFDTDLQFHIQWGNKPVTQAELKQAWGMQ